MLLLHSCFVTKGLNKLLTCHTHMLHKYVFLGFLDNLGIVKIDCTKSLASIFYLLVLWNFMYFPASSPKVAPKFKKSRNSNEHPHLAPARWPGAAGLPQARGTGVAGEGAYVALAQLKIFLDIFRCLNHSGINWNKCFTFQDI